MSFLSDLFEGNFGNLGKDIVDAPSSLIAHPAQIAEVAGALALPFVAPEIAGALGLSDVLGLGGDLAGSAASDALGGAADVGAAAVPAGVADASLAGLGGDLVGGGALSFAPTAADAAAPIAAEAAGATPGVVAGLPAAAGEAAAPAAAESVVAPADILAGDPSIEASLGLPAADTNAAGAEALSGPTTQEFAAAGQPVASDASSVGAALHTPDTNLFPMGANAAAPAANAAGSEIAASSEVPGLAGDVASGSQFAPSVDNIASNAAAGGANAAASPGILDSLKGGLSTVGSIAGNPLAQLAVPAGFLGYSLLKGPTPIPPQANAALANAGSSLAGLTNQATQNTPLFNNTVAEDLNLANNFQVSPSQAAQLEKSRQDQYNVLLQQIANQNPGGDPKQSSEWILGKQQIDADILGQQTQMINQLIQTAMSAASAANQSVSTSASITNQYDQLLMQAAQLQTQQDAAFNQSVAAALQSFGLIAGLQGSKIAKAVG